MPRSSQDSTPISELDAGEAFGYLKSIPEYSDVDKVVSLLAQFHPDKSREEHAGLYQKFLLLMFYSKLVHGMLAELLRDNAILAWKPRPQLEELLNDQTSSGLLSSSPGNWCPYDLIAYLLCYGSRFEKRERCEKAINPFSILSQNCIVDRESGNSLLRLRRTTGREIMHHLPFYYAYLFSFKSIDTYLQTLFDSYDYLVAKYTLENDSSSGVGSFLGVSGKFSDVFDQKESTKLMRKAESGLLRQEYIRTHVEAEDEDLLAMFLRVRKEDASVTPSIHNKDLNPSKSTHITTSTMVQCPESCFPSDQS